jgi:hypothetical protein
MTPRNTRTGGVLERMVLPALDQGGYTYKAQVGVGKRLSTGVHLVDAVVQKPGEKPFLVSVKWQQVSGTGWKLRDVYVAGVLKRYIVNSESVEIVTLESFVGRANQGKL